MNLERKKNRNTIPLAKLSNRELSLHSQDKYVDYGVPYLIDIIKSYQWSLIKMMRHSYREESGEEYLVENNHFSFIKS